MKFFHLIILINVLCFCFVISAMRMDIKPLIDYDAYLEFTANQKQLSNAVDKKNIQEVEEILTRCLIANKPVLFANAPMRVAILNENFSIMELLLWYNADPNFCSPLTSLVVKLVKLPKRMPLEFNEENYRGNLINVKEFKRLTKECNKRIEKDFNDKKFEYLRAIKLLLYHGANPYNKDWGKSAIDIAKENNAEELVKLLTNTQTNLIKNLHALLSRGQTPFPSEIALKIAQYRYGYEEHNA